jgi:nucleotide-binding universal stress UspA family protein
MVATAASSPAPIVIAIDFDQPSVYALRRGAEIFRRSPAFELDILHVALGLGMGVPAETEVGGDKDSQLGNTARKVPRKIEEFIRDNLGDPTALAGRRVGIHVRMGDVAEEIVKFADDIGAQLLVVGSHGRKGLMKKLMGSVSEKVLELSHTSVVIATGEPSSESPTIEPPCKECQKARQASQGKQWWCTRHAEHHARAHSFSYRREFPFAQHDSEVIPTGVDLS